MHQMEGWEMQRSHPLQRSQKDSSVRPQALAKRVPGEAEDRHDFTQLSEWRSWKWPVLPG